MSSPDGVIEKIRKENAEKERLQKEIKEKVEGAIEKVERAWDKIKNTVSNEALERVLKNIEEIINRDVVDIEKNIQEELDKIEKKINKGKK